MNKIIICSSFIIPALLAACSSSTPPVAQGGANVDNSTDPQPCPSTLICPDTGDSSCLDPGRDGDAVFAAEGFPFLSHDYLARGEECPSTASECSISVNSAPVLLCRDGNNVVSPLGPGRTPLCPGQLSCDAIDNSQQLVNHGCAGSGFNVDPTTSACPASSTLCFDPLSQIDACVSDNSNRPLHGISKTVDACPPGFCFGALGLLWSCNTDIADYTIDLHSDAACTTGSSMCQASCPDGAACTKGDTIYACNENGTADKMTPDN